MKVDNQRCAENDECLQHRGMWCLVLFQMRCILKVMSRVLDRNVGSMLSGIVSNAAHTLSHVGTLGQKCRTYGAWYFFECGAYSKLCQDLRTETQGVWCLVPSTYLRERTTLKNTVAHRIDTLLTVGAQGARWCKAKAPHGVGRIITLKKCRSFSEVS
jgi:hypothetical protein